MKVGIQKKIVKGKTLGMIKGEWKEDLQAKSSGVNQIIKSKEDKIEEQE